MINSNFVDQLNVHLQMIDISCNPEDLEKLRKLSQSHDSREVRSLGITPLVVGSLTRDAAESFNGPNPFCYDRGAGYKKMESWNSSVKPLVDDVNTIAKLVCSLRPFSRLDLDFRPVEPNATQCIDFLHIDAASLDSDFTTKGTNCSGDLLFVIINGDDGDLNTLVFPDKFENVLTVYNKVFETDFDEGASIFNERFLEQVSSITRPVNLPPNSVAFALQEYTIHGSAFNRSALPRKRSFARLSY